MNRQDKTWTLELLTTFLVVAAAIIVITQPSTGFTAGPNNRNVTVDTRVNITNSLPEIIDMTIDSSITLNAGGNKTVRVNITIRDYDGFGDITLVNATFFDDSVVDTNDTDDDNFHYTNTTCFLENGNGNFANYSCSFEVAYYANNGTNWTTNVTVRDNDGGVDTGINITDINSLLALNVTDLIDYGNMAVGDTSATSIQANVTNFGNVLINVSVYGFGNITNDGAAMICETGNISIASERFDLSAATAYASMTSLASSAQDVQGLQLPQRTNDTPGGEVINSTYWRLFIPPVENPAGECNGSIVFQAELPV